MQIEFNKIAKGNIFCEEFNKRKRAHYGEIGRIVKERGIPTRPVTWSR
jgi:hypothetical protein